MDEQNSIKEILEVGERKQKLILLKLEELEKYASWEIGKTVALDGKESWHRIVRVPGGIVIIFNQSSNFISF